MNMEKVSLKSEILLKNYSNRHKYFKGLSIRLPGVVGKNSRDNFISKLLSRILNNEPIFVHQKKSKV